MMRHCGAAGSALEVGGEPGAPNGPVHERPHAVVPAALPQEAGGLFERIRGEAAGAECGDLPVSGRAA